ncbi:probable basic-leucine zipper transcription factor S [Eurosta solidaginis]|uniref:probable basic-leucine zipper transcription factor S n=1 Tax=Eurosta solidaginis TaxID=178769 RepID=UPI00353131E8
MISPRRLALIAPLTLKHNKQNKTTNVNNSMSFQMTTTINEHDRGVTTTTSLDIKQTALTKSSHKTNIHRIINNNNIDNDDDDDFDSYTDESSDNSTDDSNEAYANIIHTYSTSDGLQTIRASFGISGLIGHNPGGGIGSISSGGNDGGHQTYSHTIKGNANLLLCGAMLSVVTTILCVVCYCCHRNIKKRTEAAYRQQHQWLDNDPNMEIYSVEQSYETSCHFLPESSDGFTTMATLHHEPPPSYDAVVAMQEQQLLQQQLYQQQYLLHQQQQQQQQQQPQTHMQHNSPPPGYRSTLAVNVMTTPTISASAAASNMTINALTNGSNNDLNGSCNLSISGNSVGGNSCNNFFACSKSNAPISRCNVNNSDTSFLNMKKALNAQSCCSLQRAEVENMWNAAAAAVAVRASRATSSPCGAASLTSGNFSSSSNTNNNRSHISPMLLTRKTLPAKFTTKTNGRRYQPHHSTYYRRGCPLCGKFRYDGDETLTLSMESALDAPTTSSALTVATNATTVAPKPPAIVDASNNNVLVLDDSCPKLTTMDEEQNTNVMTTQASQQVAGEHIMAKVITPGAPLTSEDEQCACVVNILEYSTKGSDSDFNGNNNNNSMKVIPASTNGNENCTMIIDQNANGQAMTEELKKEIKSSASDAGVALINENATSSTPNGNIAPTVLPEDTTLDDLNSSSGLIRVNMSKIIDETGLPTYEASSTLESSGYV